jgi:[ribosomal protein S18]-alanine N-acetyltransferase
MDTTPSYELGSLTLVSATIQHVDAILRIEAASFSAPWTRRMFEVELTDNPFSRFFVAQADRSGHTGEPLPEVVGYVCFWVVFEELRMMNVAVEPHVRRRGIGHALLLKALSTGIEEGARRALLEVRASNDSAVTLYERAGFVRTGMRAKYYTNPIEDAVLMEAELSKKGQGGYTTTAMESSGMLGNPSLI